jgi:hypothetical protein
VRGIKQTGATTFNTVEFAANVGWQWLLVAGVTAFCFLVPMFALHPLFPFYREVYERYNLPSTKIVPFLMQLVANEQLSPAVADLLCKLAGDAYMKDFVHLCGGVSEGLAILLSVLSPKRLLRFGCLGFAVMPALTYVLYILICEFLNVGWYNATFGYLFTLSGVQMLFVAASGLLFVLRAKLMNIRVTSKLDLCEFFVLLVLFFTAVTYFTMRFGNYARLD